MDGNPWAVTNVSVFLKFCCPECDYKCATLKDFSCHATESHDLSTTLFRQDNNLSQLNDLLNELNNLEEYPVKEEVNDNDFDAKTDDEELIFRPPSKRQGLRTYTRRKANTDFVSDDKEESQKSNRNRKRQTDVARPSKDDGWLHCERCSDKKFLFVFEVLDHLTICHGGTKYATFPLTLEEIVTKDAKMSEMFWPCLICNDKEHYFSKSQLIAHWIQKHAQDNFVYDACQWCLELFDSSESSLKHHEKVHPDLPRREYPCSLCYHHGADLSLLAKHYKQRHGTTFISPIKCNICNASDMSFIIEESLLSHKKKEHGIDIETLLCSQCSMTFLSQGTRLSHLSMHGLEDELNSSYLCKHCLNVSQSIDELVSHCKEYHELENLPYFKCDKCSFVSDRFASTEEHYKTVHGLEKYSPFACKHCNYTVNKLTEHRRHVATHKDISHICDVCGKVLKTKVSLKHHKEFYHKKSDSCVCDICGFTTSHQLWLKRHIKNKHQTEKKKICPLCEKAFRDKNTLEVHLDNKHPGTEEKKHFCQECGQGFMYQYSLTNHLYKHRQVEQKESDGTKSKKENDDPEGDVDITCQYCGQEYKHKFLKQHYRKSHPDVYFAEGNQTAKFRCSVCDEKYSRKPGKPSFVLLLVSVIFFRS